MALREEFARSGEWLFRRRSYLPILFAAVIILGITSDDYSQNRFFNSLAWELSVFAFSLFGFGIRVYTMGYIPFGTSGRNTTIQVAFVLNKTGIYSIVRHPLYLGNFFIWSGVALYSHIWWVILITSLFFWIYYERIMFAEEEFLRERFGGEYDKWAKMTPAFIPRFKNWKRSQLSFCLSNVLKNEYSGFYGIIVAFTILNTTSGFIMERTLAPAPVWRVIFMIGTIVFITLRTLNKKTDIFLVDGRSSI